MVFLPVLLFQCSFIDMNITLGLPSSSGPGVDLMRSVDRRLTKARTELEDVGEPWDRLGDYIIRAWSIHIYNP